MRIGDCDFLERESLCRLGNRSRYLLLVLCGLLRIGKWKVIFSSITVLLMHEQSIVASLLTLALEKAGKANASRILGIHLVVGDYTGVVEDAVNFYFGFLSRDTIAAGAKINYTHVPGQLRCRDCDVFFPLQRHDYHCPKCEGRRVEIVGGRELYIENMEVE
jgi:hydrogenase nickel incorporation protein HypA/HybF